MRSRAPDDKFTIFSQNFHTVVTYFSSGMLTLTFHAELLGVSAKLSRYGEIMF